MISLITTSKAQETLRKQIKAIRLRQGFTQQALADRSGVPLPTLRKFEQKGLISLEAFLKILAVLGCLGTIIKAFEQDEKPHFESIDDVLADQSKKLRKRGWRT